MNTVFYPNTFDGREQADIMRSPIWTVVSGAHYNLGGNLFLSQYTPNNATMCTTSGIPILNIMMTSGGMYRVLLNTRQHEFGIQGNPYITTIADTKNARYLVGKLGDLTPAKRVNKKSVREAIVSETAWANDMLIERVIRPITRVYTERVRPHMTAAAFSLDHEAQEWVLLVAFGHRQMLEVPSRIKPLLERAFRFYTERHDNLNDFTRDADEMFGVPKWLATWYPNYGLVAGKYDCKALASFSRAYSETGNSNPVPWNQSTVKPIEPMRYYRNINAMPEHLRTELTAALVLTRTNRPEPAKTCADPLGLFPYNENSFVQDRIGSIQWRSDSANNALTWMLVDA
jgi:hypothetical protein